MESHLPSESIEDMGRAGPSHVVQFDEDATFTVSLAVVSARIGGSFHGSR